MHFFFAILFQLENMLFIIDHVYNQFLFLTIGESAFSVNGFTSFIIPKKVTALSGFLFTTCRNLESVQFLGNVTNIENSVFYYFTSLKSIEIPERVSSIGACAFSYCNNLTSDAIPAKVENISSSFYPLQFLDK